MSFFKTQRILVPFDYSAPCVEAVEVALELAASPRDVHVLHVMANLSAADPYVIWNENADQERREGCRKAMEKKLAGLEIENVHFDVGIGNPGDAIADLAKEIEAGLIVIPSHGRKGVKRLLLGSVAERVVRLSPCPVLVLKQ